MARAAAPMFSDSWGATRIMAGWLGATGSGIGFVIVSAADKGKRIARMSVDRLAERVRTAFAGKTFSEQSMFGGIAFMLDGNMAVSVSKRGLLARVGKDGYAAALKRKGARPMIMGGRTMSGYVFVDEDGTKTDRDLKGWLDSALKHSSTLPAKKPAAGGKSKTGTKRGKP
jgi:TfoX/Sxy family transcriptional regulator of competence genes